MPETKANSRPLASTLLELLEADRQGVGVGPRYRFVSTGSPIPEISWSLPELIAHAAARAQRLASSGVSRGARVLLLHPPGPEFLPAFLGCLLHGALPVPLPHPRSRRSLGRIRGVLDDCAPELVWTADERLPAVRELIDALRWPGTLASSTTEAELHRLDERLAGAPTRGPAFLQYTSGSTGSPKGVVVTHENLAAQFRSLAEVSAMDHRDTMVTWLPHYHDMGLVGGLLFPLAVGAGVVQMSPAHFVRSPSAWLGAAAAHAGTVLVAPNFAFELCARTPHPALDLSRLRVVWNGAEPIRPEVMRRFAASFAPMGFRADAWLPCYGMAECTLMATGLPRGEAVKVVRVDTEALGRNDVVAANGRERTLVGCGRPMPGMRVVIVDPATGGELPENRVGEIWIAGDSVASGYWESRTGGVQAFAAVTCAGDGPFLRTRDLGFRRDGELFVAGRLKDVIKVRGRNIYPQDLEAVVAAALPGASPNGVAAFGLADGATEAIGVVVEADRSLVRLGERAALGDLEARAALAERAATVRRAVVDEAEDNPRTIAFVAQSEFRRTTSGKVQRSLMRDRLAAGELATIYIEPPPAPGLPAADPHAVAGAGDGPAANGGGDAWPASRAQSLCEFLRRFAERRLNSQLADQRRTLPPHVVLDLAAHGLFGLCVPAPLGGLGLRHDEVFVVLEQLGAIDLTLAAMVGIHNGLGLTPLLRTANQALREAEVPRLASGRGLLGFALTEPGAGSDVRALQTIARRVDGGFELSGDKTWIGLAPWASALVVVANAVDRAGGPLGTLTCYVRSDNPGLDVGEELLSQGMRGIPQRGRAATNETRRRPLGGSAASRKP